MIYFCIIMRVSSLYSVPVISSDNTGTSQIDSNANSSQLQQAQQQYLTQSNFLAFQGEFIPLLIGGIIGWFTADLFLLTKGYFGYKKGQKLLKDVISSKQVKDIQSKFDILDNRKDIYKFIKRNYLYISVFEHKSTGERILAFPVKDKDGLFAHIPLPKDISKVTAEKLQKIKKAAKEDKDCQWKNLPFGIGINRNNSKPKIVFEQGANTLFKRTYVKVKKALVS